MTYRIFAGAVACALLLGCANGAPKKQYEGPQRAAAELSVVHPTTVPGGQMMITKADGKSTYTASIGFLGSISVLPGDHVFEVEVSHGFSVQDAGGPAWTLPQGVKGFALAGAAGSGLLIKKGTATVSGKLASGKVYEMKFGFDRANPQAPVPMVWLAEIPGGGT